MNHGMKSRTIVSILSKKIKAWIDTIENEELQKLVKRDTVVTGGCIASMLMGEDINDFDIYFKTKETTLKVAEYYVDRFNIIKKFRGGVPIKTYVETSGEHLEIVVKSAGVDSVEGGSDYQYFETTQVDHDAGDYLSEIFDKDKIETPEVEINNYEPVFLSSNAISLKGKIQIITRFHGSPDKIHENFDFVHCTNYWESDTGKLTLKKEALECILSKTLVYQGSLFPICSIFRIRKFVERGWRINVGQILKMCLQVNDLDLRNPVILKSQLIGVDVAYFTEIWRKLNEKNPEKIDTAYLVELLDRMF